MLKYILIITLFIAVIVFATNRGLHRSFLDGVRTDVVLSRWSETFKADVMRDFASLPALDRTLIEQRCAPIFKRSQKLRGTTDSLPHDLEPECQALLRGGWQPGWTVQSGITFIRNEAR